MQEHEFNARVDAILEALEIALDDVDSDLDYESSGGILTVEFEPGNVMVFSRQSGNDQLWVAARSGGYHFAYDDASDQWSCTRSGREFRELVTSEMKLQGGIDIVLS